MNLRAARPILGFLATLVALRSFLLLANDQAETIKDVSDRRLLFVHVGKTGGETIKWRLRVICDQRASKRKKARCLDMFRGEESALSRLTIGYMHCDKLRPKESLQQATTFLYSLRDPIDRAVSWYQYMHPHNCLPDFPSAACNLKKGNNTWGLKFYGECFPTVNEMAEILQHPVPTTSIIDDNFTSISCFQMALDTLQGRGPQGPTNHMHFNYVRLTNQTTLQHPEGEVMVVRQEFLWDDLRGIEALLGGNSGRPFEMEGPTVTHGSERFKYHAVLVDSVVPTMCCALQDEIKMYAALLSTAVNLNAQQRQDSVESLLAKCKVGSLHDMSIQCLHHSNAS